MPDPTNRRARVLAATIVFVAFLDVFAMLPTVAPYAEQLGAGLTGVGVAVGAYSATNLVFNVVGGVAVDRLGRRRLLLGSLLLAALSMAGYAAASGVTAFVAARLAHGVAGGVLIPAVFTVAGDVAPGGREGRSMGRAGALIGAAAVIAPALAGGLRQAWGFGAVFAAVAAAMVAGAVLVGLGLPETADEAPATRPRAAIGDLLRLPTLQAACIGVFAFTVAVGSLAAFLPLHADDLSGPAATTGALFTLFAVVAVVVMLSPLSRLVDRRGPVIPTMLGLGLVAAGLAGLALRPALVATALAVAVFGLGYGLVFPAVTGAAAAVPAARGTAFGLLMAFFSLGLVVGPPLAGGLAETTPIDPFLPAVAACLAGAGAVWWRSRRV